MKYILSAALCLITSLSWSQQCFVNPSILENKTSKAVIECWKGYLQSSPDSLYDNPYWNETDKRKYRSYDLLRSEGYLAPSLYHLYRQGYSNEILQIEPMGDAYVIHSMFYFLPQDGSIYPLATVRVIAKPDESGTYKLHNWSEYHTRNWYTRQVGIINYIYHPAHPFNLYKAEQANRLIGALARTFGIKTDRVDYYIAPSCSEIYKLKGFTDVVGMYCTECNNLCGFTDRINNIIYSNSTEGEFYSHELMRLINNFFPYTEGVFINGLAAYINKDNGLGIPFKEHFRSMDDYLNKHPKTDLGDLYSWGTLDDKTNPTYYIGMLICHLCLEKGGLPLLKKGMSVDSRNKTAIYDFLEKEINIPRQKLNKELRKKIHDICTEGFTPIDFLSL